MMAQGFSEEYTGVVRPYWTGMAIPVFPVQWQVGPGHGGARRVNIGGDPNLTAYQDAVRHWISRVCRPEAYDAPAYLSAYFFRKTATWAGQADLTNLMKGFEDALQGSVIKNDRYIKLGLGRIMEQGPTARFNGVIFYVQQANDSTSGVPARPLERHVNFLQDYYERQRSEDSNLSDEEVPF